MEPPVTDLKTDISSEIIELEAADGATLSAYRVRPSGRVRGGVVVVQEIFGVNAHIRSVADGYAQRGYDVIAPAFFDRVERGVELDYGDEGRTKGRALAGQLGFDKPLLDVSAAIAQLSRTGKVGIVGYCWGGSLSFLAAARVTGLSAAVGYYGSAVAKHASEKPRVPTILHFGEQDQGIPLSDVEQVKQQRPELAVYTYDAGHGFNRDVGTSYSKPAAELALSRTLVLFEQHIG
jgi:carboxymethylenebutenolidase